LLAAVIADVFLPVPSSAGQTSTTLRQAALPLFGSGFFGLFVFTLQTTRARLERRHEVLRAGCKLLLAAVQTVLELHAELKWYPLGRPLPGVQGANAVQLGDVARAEELEQEWRRLYREGERDVIFEEGPDGPTFVAWRTVRDSFWGWSDANRRRADAATLEALENTLKANAKAFGARCHEALQGLG
jgi:multidrug efflux pump subunit AcrA (membrane-fusion protein)